MKTKIISVLLIFTIIFSATAFVASATENVVMSGEYGENLMWDFSEETGTLTISGNGDMYECSTSERPWEFLYDRIKAVVVSDGVTSISDGAFIDFPELTDITIGKNVKTIGRYAFAYCTSLTEITIPDSVTSIAAEAFGYCDIFKKINIGSGLESLDVGPFIYSFKLENITVSPQNPYLSIDEHGVLFDKDKTVLLIYPSGKPDTEYTIPDGVKTVNFGAFHFSQSLKSIKAPDSIETIGSNAFYACTSLENFSIPRNTVQINDYAFMGTKITNITLPESLESMGYSVFDSCADVKTVYIPASLKFIDNYNFRGCTSVTDVYYGGSEEEWNQIEMGRGNDPILNATIHFNHTHSQAETIEAEAECNKKGLKSFSCDCGHYYTENIPETTDHIPTDWVYYADRVFHKNCSVCGLTLEETTVWWSFSLIENEMRLVREQEFRFSVIVYGGGYDGMLPKIFPADLNATSSNEDVATIQKNVGYERTGFIIDAINTGETTITVSMVGTDISESFHITVTPFVYHVIWYVDGEQIRRDMVLEGEPIYPPEPPVKEGYEFVGWSPEVPETAPLEHTIRRFEFEAIFNKVTKAENYDVTASYPEDTFDEAISLDVKEIEGEREPGGVYMVDGQYYEQLGLYNIKPVNVNSDVIQPNEGYTVTLSIPIPEAYKDRTDFIIYHRFVNGGREQLSTSAGTIRIENGCLVFEVSKFSEFELLVASDSIRITNLPAKTVYAFAEDIDLNGIVVIYTNADGEETVITDAENLTVSDYDSRKTGTQTVIVNYGNCTDTFEVTVKYTFWQWIIRILTFGFYKF